MDTYHIEQVEMKAGEIGLKDKKIKWSMSRFDSRKNTLAVGAIWSGQYMAMVGGVSHRFDPSKHVQQAVCQINFPKTNSLIFAREKASVLKGKTKDAGDLKKLEFMVAAVELEHGVSQSASMHACAFVKGMPAQHIFGRSGPSASDQNLEEALAEKAQMQDAHETAMLVWCVQIASCAPLLH
jgi:hypothetical protein